jgi:hypothetical protein
MSKHFNSSTMYMEGLKRKRSTPTRSLMTEVNNNSILFTIGRMNPPTPGHKKLVQQMIVDALNNETHVVFVNLTSTTGLNSEGKVNPLACKDKKMIVQRMIEQIKNELKNEYDPSKIDDLQVIVNCADDDDIQNPSRPNQIPDLLIGMFNKLRMIEGYNERLMPERINFRLYLGEKDFGKFNWLEKTFPFNDKTSGSQFDLKSIKVKRPPGDMSATYLRNLTIRDDAKFIQAMLALAEEQGKELTEKEMRDLAALDRQFIFIEEMSKVGLNDDEATHLFVAIQREIERYNDNASSVRKTTTRKKKGGKRSNGHKRRTRKRIKKSKGRR